MKTRTEKILMVLKYVALLGGIGFSIECGTHLTSFVASFINVDWAKRIYQVDQSWFDIREYNVWYYSFIMVVLITLSALKATVWYIVYNLLSNLKLRRPFSMEVAERLERIGYLLFGAWAISVIGKIYMEWLPKVTHIPLTGIAKADEYFFLAGMVYIISQIFKRGIEIQEENQLTV